ncbi:MAG: phosphate signaling complex protein PhoU [Hyphomicrobiales bacterium]
MADHIVSAFDDDLEILNRNIAQMGGLAEEQLAASVDALVRNDQELASQVIRDDVKIDDLEREIEEKAILTIAKRQPMALDLRQIMTAIKIASDLERIGDLAKNISKRSSALSDERPKKIISGLKSMGKLALNQLKNVLDAYIQRDAEKARQVWQDDEELDAMYNSVFRELLTYMMEDPRNIGICTHLLFGAKNIERIGDHATNIAENVHYLVHGVPLIEERPKSDVTSETKIEVEI